jgi:hypothetical protein
VPRPVTPLCLWCGGRSALPPGTAPAPSQASTCSSCATKENCNTTPHNYHLRSHNDDAPTTHQTRDLIRRQPGSLPAPPPPPKRASSFHHMRRGFVHSHADHLDGAENLGAVHARRGLAAAPVHAAAAGWGVKSVDLPLCKHGQGGAAVVYLDVVALARRARAAGTAATLVAAAIVEHKSTLALEHARYQAAAGGRVSRGPIWLAIACRCSSSQSAAAQNHSLVRGLFVAHGRGAQPQATAATPPAAWSRAAALWQTKADVCAQHAHAYNAGFAPHMARTASWAWPRTQASPG